MKKLLLFTLLISPAFNAFAQDIPRDSVIPAIRYIEAQPFDTAKIALTKRLLTTVEKNFPPRAGDKELIITMGKHIKPPVIYFLTRAYIFGRAAYLYEANEPDYDSAKIQGTKEMIRLYRYMKQHNSSFHLPLLDDLDKMQSSGRLSAFIVKYLNDSAVTQRRHLAAIQTKPFIHGIAADPQYGYVAEKPIEVGGRTVGARKEILYLNQLKGSGGETVSYKRRGACCPFKTTNAIVGDSALLDVFEIKFKGKDTTVNLYVDMYDQDTLYCPKGFSVKTQFK